MDTNVDGEDADRTMLLIRYYSPQAPRGLTHFLSEIDGVELRPPSTTSFKADFGLVLLEALYKWVVRAPEVVTLYLSHPAGSAIAGAAAAKLIEKVIDAILEWAGWRADKKRVDIQILLYGPDGKPLVKRTIRPQPKSD